GKQAEDRMLREAHGLLVEGAVVEAYDESIHDDVLLEALDQLATREGGASRVGEEDEPVCQPFRIPHLYGIGRRGTRVQGDAHHEQGRYRAPTSWRVVFHCRPGGFLRLCRGSRAAALPSFHWPLPDTVEDVRGVQPHELPLATESRLLEDSPRAVVRHLREGHQLGQPQFAKPHANALPRELGREAVPPELRHEGVCDLDFIPARDDGVPQAATSHELIRAAATNHPQPEAVLLPV